MTAVGVALVLVGGSIVISLPPDFVPGTVSIEKGSSASAIAEKLARADVIAYATPLRIILRVAGYDGAVHAGTYRFNTPESLFRIIRRLLAADYGLPLTRITFEEGTTVRETAKQVAAALPGISAEEFLTVAKQYEGYLFPDTYFFSPSADAAAIVAVMRANFDMNTALISEEITASHRPLSDIVIMASLIEKEARTEESKRMVAGILWNRLERGMPLQVDAVFGYIFERDTYSPSLTDLRVNSPYNTYTHKGLPPGPIANPGIESINAALHPAETNYLYYLTGSDTLMHYATTFAGHQANRNKYLK